MNVDLVFEGGGVLGICYAGALKALEERGYTPQRCAGTSAGSVIAALIAAGYTSGELMNIIHKMDFGSLLKSNGPERSRIPSGIFSLIYRKGAYDSGSIEAWVESMLEKKGVTRFKDVMHEGKSMLKIIAADITGKRVFILPDDLRMYGVNPMEFSIAKAVRMSCAIPLFFTPVELKYRGKKNYIVDGGLLSNYPIWIFDVEGTPRWPTFGLKLKDPSSFTSQGKADIISYVKDIILAPINVDQENFVRDKDNVRTITINCPGNIKATDFAKANQHIDELCKSGYECTDGFINNWNFNRYVNKYRK